MCSELEALKYSLTSLLHRSKSEEKTLKCKQQLMHKQMESKSIAESTSSVVKMILNRTHRKVNVQHSLECHNFKVAARERESTMMSL